MVIFVLGSVLVLLGDRHCTYKVISCWYANQMQIEIYDLSRCIRLDRFYSSTLLMFN